MGCVGIWVGLMGWYIKGLIRCGLCRYMWGINEMVYKGIN